MKKILVISCIVFVLLAAMDAAAWDVVDTGQSHCYDDTGTQITCPSPGQPFHGQDAQHQGVQPQFVDNGDGTVSDLVTGLMWQQDPNGFQKMTFTQAQANAGSTTTGGHTDWRLPTIKELYSLINFDGITGTSAADSTPYIDTNYFDFQYGDTSAGERFIDAQYATSTQYVSTVMSGQTAVFGVNFADGRIKGYGLTNPQGQDFEFYVQYVRGAAYGVNDFQNNGDGTVTDLASNLMWTQADSGQGMNWEEALAWVEQQNAQLHLGYDDWRLPNAKELQSIVDYTRSPDTTGSAAIDPVFSSTAIVDEGGSTNYPFYWSSTTHLDGPVGVRGTFASYVAFGEALGFMEVPPGSGNYVLMDVHGAGAQRSDPKSGNPANWPNGNGPQGDVVRIDNFVRLVRDITSVPPQGENYVVGQGLGQPNPNRVRVHDAGGTPTAVDFLAYSAGAWGVNVASGDLDADGYGEIVTGPGPGDVFGPQVRGFARDGSSMGRINFFAYGTLKFGVNAAAGDLDGDTFAELVSAAGPGDVFGPHLRGWNYDGGTLATMQKINFFAYSTLKFGANAALGDLDGDGFVELLSGAGPGAIFGSSARGWDYDGATLGSIARINFNAYSYQYGVNVAAGDVDADAFAEIATAPGPDPAATCDLRGFDYDGSALAALTGFQVTPSSATRYGGRVGLGEVTGDASAELMAGLGRDPSAGSTVHPYEYDGSGLTALSQFLPFAGGTYGVNVTGGNLGY